MNELVKKRIPNAQFIEQEGEAYKYSVMTDNGKKFFGMIVKDYFNNDDKNKLIDQVISQLEYRK